MDRAILPEVEVSTLIEFDPGHKGGQQGGQTRDTLKIRIAKKMTHKIDIDELKQSISIVELVSQQYELVPHGAQLRAKVHDSLVVFPANNSWTWYSRPGRGGKALGGSIIDWYMLVNGCDFKTAVRELDLGSLRSGTVPAMVAAPPRPTDHDEQWQRRAKQKMETAQRHLANGKEPGIAYLQSRSLDIEVCQQFGVGFDPMVHYSKDEQGKWLHAPAIMFPYLDLDSQAIGIRYRWLEPINGQKSYALGRSRFGLAEFGLYQLWVQNRRSTILFVVEGELNALSIIQSGYDAVSVGSESTAITDALIELSKGYYFVICWFDKSKYAAKNASLLEAKAIRSPHGLDANDLLQKGMLAEFLERVI